MFMYGSSLGKSNRSHSKSEFHRFSLISTPMLVSLGRTPIWRLYTELYKFLWNVLATNSRMVYCTDLRLTEIVSLLIFCKLCGSRKYPYPTHGRDFSYDPPPLWIFQKRPTNYAPPSGNSNFFPTPPGNISISCLKRKIS